MDGTLDAAPKPRRSRPVRVADEIKQWVVERDLKQGDKLPNESEMITLFAVSKGTVREAMRILEAQGLIVTRTGPGGGSFVGKVSADRAKSLLANYFYFQDLSLADIYQMRRVLEPEMAASLAGHLTPAQLDELQALAERYPTPARSADEEKEQHIASLEFHARLSDFSGNRLMGFVIAFMARILTDLTVYRRLYDPPNLQLWQRGRDHQLRLVDALRRGDADAARATMASHMEGAEAMMVAQEAQLAKRFMGE
ncbi:FCD domain-containing protein [Mesobacterium sp. TK19101]|uniref:FCD domain-containing protein n=1 Tax=Mesobacterium hydrothermale TaxID=3111907 RepID=A0ABU6HDW0_9RHOB|nr:FCD domain-containing protein [Mesobacterium sp. TK19101]MEC3860647.1 FCD domain-containing protein [Mesobacterium sp. TK19101]